MRPGSEVKGWRAGGGVGWPLGNGGRGSGGYSWSEVHLNGHCPHCPREIIRDI